MPRKTNAFQDNLPLFHRALARWYALHGRRGLPWRNTRDPYHIYISEIMLQQTQVKTVLERYYAPFLRQFPTLAALAASKPESVTKAWEGLGYYNRAANLHRAARECGSTLPSQLEALMDLPGIGRNTAHAVACFGFGAAVPVMEANVKRVLHRVFALRKADDATLWRKAAELLDTSNAFDYNQAMMDVGALVCTKTKPQCGLCPLNTLCEGKTSPLSYPVPKKARQVPVRRRVIVAFHDGKGRYWLSVRTSRFLNGLFGFMEYEAGGKNVLFSGKRYSLSNPNRLGVITQSYSHFTLQADVYSIKIHDVKGKLPEGSRKVSLKEIRTLPLSRADQKVLELLAAKGE
jgi:A/G-specific adenine glycosylase